MGITNIEVAGIKCPHQRYLMIEIELVEIHDIAPVSKRERYGLSAVSAYGCHLLAVISIWV